eukprot:7534072-Pyramimonas_sp.AAC.1
MRFLCSLPLPLRLITTSSSLRRPARAARLLPPLIQDIGWQCRGGTRRNPGDVYCFCHAHKAYGRFKTFPPGPKGLPENLEPVSYTHLRAHETGAYL